MTRSMTGFGKASCDFDGDVVSVELSSVNHRYLDCSVRLPMAWSVLEPVVKETVKNHLTRGRVHITVTRKRGPGSGGEVRFDTHLARKYIEASKELNVLLGSYETLSLNVLAQLEGVFYHEEAEEDLDRVKDVLTDIVNKALTQLDGMRVTEGRALADDLRQRVDLMRQTLATVEQRLPQLNEFYCARLKARIAELNLDAGLTEERIAIEVALMAEKGDVTEEVVRFKAHLDHMLEMLESKEPVGRRLDFLAQEVQREINTLGVKTRDADVAKDVLNLKAELEKIKEQVQNIE
ncbi:MAG: YicC family protein [Candidatus Hydrogenedentes bacterium]|nr:YicC family protein [Candidatus Hydrogenedentota bacterium]